MTSTATTKSRPPRHNEIEISLFGPGIGECLVIHPGLNRWMIVDSCLNESRQRSIALDYLEELGVDASSQIEWVLATHWHDDHIAGLAGIINRATSAKFACSAALRCREFLDLVSIHDKMLLVEDTSGISEFEEVIRILQHRTHRHGKGPDLWANANMRILQNSFGVEVWALSPSAQSVTNGLGEIARLLPKPREIIRRFPVMDANDQSVVLRIDSPSQSFLLGADLEIQADTRCGWRAILAEPHRVSAAYKVAHHGSPNADCQEIWDRLVVRDACALLTPFAAGRVPRPSDEDVARLKRCTNRLYCTVWPSTKKPPRRQGVDKTMNEVTKMRRAIHTKSGHIRVRAPLDYSSDIQIELFDGAKQL